MEQYIFNSSAEQICEAAISAYAQLQCACWVKKGGYNKEEESSRAIKPQGAWVGIYKQVDYYKADLASYAQKMFLMRTE